MRSILVSIISLVALVAFASVAFAQAVDPMHEGLAKLNEGKTADAQAAFLKAVKSSPNNVQAHYCLAVCYHRAQEYAAAVSEYSWVCKHASEPNLLRRAEKGLSACQPLAAQTMTAMPSFGPIAGAAADGATAGAGAPGGNAMNGGGGDTPSLADSLGQVGGAGAAAGRHAAPAHAVPAAKATTSRNPIAPTNPTYISLGGTPKVIDVYTDWCGWCKRFEPNFEQARDDFAGRVEFYRVNAEAPGGPEFCKKYDIHGYPTFVLVDANGNAANIIRGCPKTLADFEASIKEAFPSAR